MNMSRKELAEHISSFPVEICFCGDDNTYDCTAMHRNISVRRGGPVRLMATAVDQVQNQAAATVIAEFSNKGGHFKEEQAKRYIIQGICTELEYNVCKNRN